ncbi:ADP-ribosylglycohydrolase [Streptomyces sp. SolWspMP-sol7th]|nr:ADP-ribosylglycohydrolase [Streptomyces sp. SolWspMP-sol7th]
MARIADVPEAGGRAEPTDLDGIVAACPEWPGAGAYDGDPVALEERLEAAWRGRAAGCVLGKPVEKLPLDGIRALARAAGNWPLRTWFTARGVPADLLAAYPWNRRSAGNCLAENIAGTPEDDDLDHPVLTVELLLRHGRDFTTADLAALWLEQLPAGKVFTAERVAYANLLRGVEPPETARHRNPFREWIGGLDQGRRARLDAPGRPGRRRGTGVAGRGAEPHGQRRVRGDVRGGRARGGDRARRGRAPLPRDRPARRAARVPPRARDPRGDRPRPYPRGLRHRRRRAARRPPGHALGARRPERGAARRRAHARGARGRRGHGGGLLHRRGDPYRLRRLGHGFERSDGRVRRRSAPRGPRGVDRSAGEPIEDSGQGELERPRRDRRGLRHARPAHDGTRPPPRAAPDQPARRPAARERVLVRDVPATDGEAPPPTATRSPTP